MTAPPDPPTHEPGDPPAPEPIPLPPPPRAGLGGHAVISVLVVLLLGLWLVTGLGRIWRDPPTAVAAAVVFLPYLYAAYLALVFAAWSLLPDRKPLPALLAAGTLTAAALWGPAWPARGSNADGEPLRVMEWNVQRLWGTEGAAACVVDAVTAEAPDALVLLEASRRDVQTLSDALDLQCVHTDYRGTGRDDHGGLAACTRGSAWRLRGGSAQRYVDEDSWQYVFTELERGERVVNLLAVHLVPYRFSAGELREGMRELVRGEPGALVDLGESGRKVVRAQGAQSAALLSRVERFHDPTVVAGDFNSTRDAALHASLRGHLTDAWERGGQGLGATVLFGGRVPLRIDYIYTTEQLAVRSTRVLDLPCADHAPVITDLALLPD